MQMTSNTMYRLALQALILLEGMREAGGELLPDVVSYNTCIKACGQAGRVTEALQVFSPLWHNLPRDLVSIWLSGNTHQ